MSKMRKNTQRDGNNALKLSPSALQRMRDTVAKVALLGEPYWPEAAAGNEAAAIRVVLGQGRNSTFTRKFDVSMMALALCVCNGGNTARMVADYVLNWPVSDFSFALATALALPTNSPRRVRKSAGRRNRGALPRISNSSASKANVHV